jgi:hypothetical protein
MIHNKDGLYTLTITDKPYSLRERIDFLESQCQQIDERLKDLSRQPDCAETNAEIDSLCDRHMDLVDEIQRLESALSDQDLR